MLQETDLFFSIAIQLEHWLEVQEQQLIALVLLLAHCDALPSARSSCQLQIRVCKPIHR